MKQRYTWEVLYQEIDADKRMRLPALESHLLIVAGKVADEYGYGQRYLNKQNLSWIVTNCSIEMQEMPQAGDILVIETWIESNAHMLSVRDFRLYKDTGYWDPDLDEMDEKEREKRRILIGRAKTTWAVLDLEKREIFNAFNQSAFDNIVDGEVLDMPKAARMTPITPTPSATDSPTSFLLDNATHVSYSCVDYNDHCNSCKYPEFMLDVFKPDWLNKPFRFDIRYVREVRRGQMIETIAKVEEKKVSYQQEDEHGHIVCSAQIESLAETEC